MPEPGRLLLDVVALGYCPKRYSIPKLWCLSTACSILAQPSQACFARCLTGTPKRQARLPRFLSCFYRLYIGSYVAQLALNCWSLPQNVGVVCFPLPKNDATAVWASRVSRRLSRGLAWLVAESRENALATRSDMPMTRERRIKGKRLQKSRELQQMKATDRTY